MEHSSTQPSLASNTSGVLRHMLCWQIEFMMTLSFKIPGPRPDVVLHAFNPNILEVGGFVEFEASSRAVRRAHSETLS